MVKLVCVVILNNIVWQLIFIFCIKSDQNRYFWPRKLVNPQTCDKNTISTYKLPYSYTFKEKLEAYFLVYNNQ